MEEEPAETAITKELKKNINFQIFQAKKSMKTCWNYKDMNDEKT